MPVRLTPGCARLVIRPSATGSVPTEKTIGIVEVAFLAARAAGAHLPRLRRPDAQRGRPPAPTDDRSCPRPSGIRYLRSSLRDRIPPVQIFHCENLFTD
jgi:hypothetical protein